MNPRTETRCYHGFGERLRGATTTSADTLREIERCFAVGILRLQILSFANMRDY